MSKFSFDTDRRGGQGMALAVGLWVLLLLGGALCLWWGFFGPLPGQPEPATGEATPTEAGLAPLPIDTPAAPGGADQQPASPPEQEEFGYGIAADALLLTEYTMGQVQSLGLGWIKQQVRWSDFEPSPGQMDWSGYDAVVDAANQHGLRVMLSVVVRRNGPIPPIGTITRRVPHPMTYPSSPISWAGWWTAIGAASTPSRSGTNRTWTVNGTLPRVSTRRDTWRCCGSPTR